MSTTHNVKVRTGTVINTKVITTVSELDQCLKDLLLSIGEDAQNSTGIRYVVGLDIEKQFTPISSCYTANGGGRYQVAERVAVLKLCYESTCLIIQLSLLEAAPCSLSSFLQLKWIVFAGIGIKHCLEALEMNYGIKCRNAVDLSQLVAKSFPESMYEWWPLQDLVKHFCHMDSDSITKQMSNCKAVALSNWGVTTLSQQQIEAATFDAFACFLLEKNLLSGHGRHF